MERPKDEPEPITPEKAIEIAAAEPSISAAEDALPW